MFSFSLPVNRIRRVFNLSQLFIYFLTEQGKGFDFTENQQSVFATLNNFTENNCQSEAITEVQADISTLSNTTTDKSYNNIRELLQDDSMFHLDRDPSLFESMSFGDDLNNNLGLEQIKEFESIYSDKYIAKCSEFEIYSDLPESLIEGEMTEKKETSPPASPAPVVVDAVKNEEPTEKKTAEFDLINYIFFGDVSFLRNFHFFVI